jgi:phenylacetate-CoA ligase
VNPPDAVAARQLGRLQQLIAAIAGTNRFYAPRLAAAGIDGAIESLTEFSRRLSFTTKADLAADQAAHPPFGTNLTYPLEHYTRFCQTSGTTGHALAILDTPESWEWMLGNWMEIYRAAEVTAGDRVYFGFSFGPFLGFWTAFEAATKLGCLCLPGGGLSSHARLRAILQYRANVLLCTPTYALHLGETAAKEGIDLAASAMRKIIVAGEPGGSVPAIRERIHTLWPGAELIDHYGMTETGPVAYQSLSQPGHLRILEESYYAEVVDSTSGEPAPPGETGELVLTTLGRTGSPLLRYRTGDLIIRDPNEPGFALRGGVVGRADDMIVVRGVNIYPAAVEATIRSIPNLGEYRVEVSRRGHMAEIAVEIEAETDEAVSALEHAFASAFSLRIPVTRAPSGSLPRFEMKARRWTRKDGGGKQSSHLTP